MKPTKSMFSYYGAKTKIVGFYPKPKFDKIIEPFAGSARYALKYWENEVELVDKWYKVVEIWHYLQQASPQDILGLPKPKQGDTLENYPLTDPEKWFLGFLCGRGSRRPNFTVHSYSSIENDLKRIAADIHKIKHWNIQLGDYSNITNQKATWFIDPPYVVGGANYNEQVNSYLDLSDWCKERQGQVIVCENEGNNAWLPFVPLKESYGMKGKKTEVIWTNEPLNIGKQNMMF